MQLMRTNIKSRTSSTFGKIQAQTVKIGALERLEKSP